jgi:glutamyl-tRNA synthetase
MLEPERDAPRSTSASAASPPRGRLAPSPSGKLHLGHARTFVLAWLHAKSRGGQVLLRLEDLDTQRCRPEHAAGILRDLEWLGLDWDGPVVTQSSRLAEIGAAAERLREAGFAYPCVCTRADLRNASSAPQRGVDEQRYPGTCRGKGLIDRAAIGPFALRFRVPEGPIRFVDGIAGPRAFDVAAEVGDFIIANRARVPSYQLAVVVDDAAQGIDEVFRGDDLLSSTPRQTLLYSALGLTAPRWYHAPLVLDAAGRRLAKRADDLSLGTLRQAGVDARAIVGWALESTGLPRGSRVTPREASTAFDIGRLSREPVSLTEQAIADLFAAR